MAVATFSSASLQPSPAPNNGTYYSDYYSGPCYCAILFGEGRISNDSGVFFPSLHNTIIAGQPTTITWNTTSASSTATLSLTLYYYSGTCEERTHQDIQSCSFSESLEEALSSVPNSGEAVWTPSKDLESRNDYVLQGCVFENATCYNYDSRLFTIVKSEGEEPFSLPTIPEIQANLSSRLGLTSSTASTKFRPSATSSVGVETTPTASSTATPASAVGMNGARQEVKELRLTGVRWLGFWMLYILCLGAALA